MDPTLKFAIIAICLVCLAVLFYGYLSGDIGVDERNGIYVR
jgi:hypothetical protein